MSAKLRGTAALLTRILSTGDEFVSPNTYWFLSATSFSGGPILGNEGMKLYMVIMEMPSPHSLLRGQPVFVVTAFNISHLAPTSSREVIGRKE